MDTKKLRQKILDLAIHGKLVPQDPNDEPASVLLERIRKEKEQLIKEGKIKAPKKSKSAGDTSHYPKENLPKGWIITDLDSLCTTINGLWKGVKGPLETIGVIRNANFTKEFTLDYSKIEYIDVESRSFEKRYLDDGDIIVEKSGGSDNYPVGRSILYNGESRKYSFSNFTMSLRLIDKRSVLPKYLYYVLQQKYRRGDMKQMQTQTTGLHNLLTDIFLSMPIPIPPKEEQKRIIERVDALFTVVSGIDALQGDLAHSVDAAKSSILELAIHGKLVPQNPSDEPAIELLKRINPDFTPSHNLHYGESLPNGWTCGLFGELNQHHNKSEDPMASPEKEYELYSVPIYETGRPEFLLGKAIGSTKQLVSKGEVLLCKINPHLNRSWVVSHYRKELKCIASSEWLVFRSEAVLPEYARLFFMSPAFKDLMLSNVSGVGGSLMRARASAVNNYPIWVPPLNEQERIVQAVRQMNATLESMTSILE